jgi:hypothetical protein
MILDPICRMAASVHFQKDFFQMDTRKHQGDTSSIFENKYLRKVVAGAGFEPTTFGL